MSAFAIFVTINLKPNCFDDYMTQIQLDAEGARKDEPGCQLFHILVPEEGGNIVHLYEVYETEKAFKIHQQTPHFTRYIKATESLVQLRTIQRLEKIS